MVIESFSNPKYKYLLSLSKSKTRKKDGLFLMEGRPELDLAIKSGYEPAMIAFSEAYIQKSEIVALIGEGNTQFIPLSKALFDSLSYQNVPQNFIGVFSSFSSSLEDLQEGPMVLLEKVEKPGNLGAILRTCDALGIKNVLVTDSPVDLFNPNILRNSRGALFALKCVFTSNEKALEYFRKRGLKVLSAALSDQSIDYRKASADNNVAYVFGSEANGLSEFWLTNSDENIIIPMQGVVDSLNVSVSVAIILSHHVNGKTNS